MLDDSVFVKIWAKWRVFFSRSVGLQNVDEFNPEIVLIFPSKTCFGGGGEVVPYDYSKYILNIVRPHASSLFSSFTFYIALFFIFK